MATAAGPAPCRASDSAFLGGGAFRFDVGVDCTVDLALQSTSKILVGGSTTLVSGHYEHRISRHRN